ncbi:MAG: DUF933 domain-containing protein [Gemmatimonadetes bacterium]|nr:DUF933 domain-containing protein [Gemmatimonadota bacterium]
MRFGLAGFAGSGKTTLFNAMTGLDVPVGYGGEIRVGTVRVPDPRLDFLSGVISPKKTTYATINLRDVPGEHGAGARYLSPNSLQEIRDREALCLVLRDFVNPALDTDPDPLGDLRAFHDECVLADLAVVERRLDRARKERADIREIDAFETMTAALEGGRALRLLSEAELHRGFLKGYGLLTDLPLLVAVNVEEERADGALDPALDGEARDMGGAAMVLSAGVEAEIAALDAEDQGEFLEDMGLSEPALARFIRAAYGLMDLVSFFTIGKDEVRAWTIRRGTVARKAAGRVHSDMERGFIRAEVIPYDVFAHYGSEHAVKEAGLMRVEGRDYVVADGDLLHVRFNV